MARPSATDWDICKNCEHTVNTHTHKGVIGDCSGYLCECKNYEKRQTA
jgi:hypothetical protein